VQKIFLRLTHHVKLYLLESDVIFLNVFISLFWAHCALIVVGDLWAVQTDCQKARQHVHCKEWGANHNILNLVVLIGASFRDTKADSIMSHLNSAVLDSVGIPEQHHDRGDAQHDKIGTEGS
jgi:hypothetical protein